MDKLYAPWRDRYVRHATKQDQVGACVFCALFDAQESDEQRFILWKNEQVVVALNLYPYNGGHLLVIPKNHVEQLYEVDQTTQALLIHAAAASTQILKNSLRCDGINFGANIGKFSGAGIPQHIHLHIVPRFAGDTGFFSTIGSGKQISVDLEKIYTQLKPLFDQNFLR